MAPLLDDARAALLLALLLSPLSCSSGSGGASNCDAGACASIASQILQNGGGAGTCVEPTPKFETACQAYETCLKQCGQ